MNFNMSYSEKIKADYIALLKEHQVVRYDVKQYVMNLYNTVDNRVMALNQDSLYSPMSLSDRLKGSSIGIMFGLMTWMICSLVDGEFLLNLFFIALPASLVVSYMIWLLSSDVVICYRFGSDYFAIKSYDKIPYIVIFTLKCLSALALLASCGGVIYSFYVSSFYYILILFICVIKALAICSLSLKNERYEIIPYDSIIGIQLSQSQDKLRVIYKRIDCIHDNPKGLKEQVSDLELYLDVYQIKKVVDLLKSRTEDGIRMSIDVDNEEDTFDTTYYQILRAQFNKQYPEEIIRAS